MAGYPDYLNALVVYFNHSQASPDYYTASVNPKTGTFQLNTISLDPKLGVACLSIYATGVNGVGPVPGRSLVARNKWCPPFVVNQINVQIPPGLSGIVWLSIPGSDQIG